LGRLREVATRPRGPSMWMRSLTTGILCGGEAGAGGYRSKSRAWRPKCKGGRTSLRGQDTWPRGAGVLEQRLRNALLSKLIRGEIRVKEAERFVQDFGGERR
jgi:hypothetical protein